MPGRGECWRMQLALHPHWQLRSQVGRSVQLQALARVCALAICMASSCLFMPCERTRDCAPHTHAGPSFLQLLHDHELLLYSALRPALYCKDHHPVPAWRAAASAASTRLQQHITATYSDPLVHAKLHDATLMAQVELQDLEQRQQQSSSQAAQAQQGAAAASYTPRRARLLLGSQLPEASSAAASLQRWVQLGLVLQQALARYAGLAASSESLPCRAATRRRPRARRAGELRAQAAAACSELAAWAKRQGPSRWTCRRAQACRGSRRRRQQQQQAALGTVPPGCCRACRRPAAHARARCGAWRAARATRRAWRCTRIRPGRCSRGW